MLLRTLICIPINAGLVFAVSHSPAICQVGGAHNANRSASAAVDIEMGNVAGLPDAPIGALVTAAKEHPAANTIHLSWSFAVGSASMVSAMRYDRSRHTLHYYNYGWAMTHTTRQYFVYSHVSEEVLSAVMADAAPVNMAVQSALPMYLPKRGCKLHWLHWPGDPFTYPEPKRSPARRRRKNR